MFFLHWVLRHNCWGTFGEIVLMAKFPWHQQGRMKNTAWCSVVLMRTIHRIKSIGLLIKKTTNF